ncbi:MAG: Gfo/Idh/MocA family oxidoreductase [Planctomycetota bacterium]|nr:Gfo/Idh/MocA family oxidoreductase [Planctomycetota bacterium]MEC7497834.1 Gfo/Idh/MocA family oxidoreductase [Planctomycetota bacterium]
MSRSAEFPELDIHPPLPDLLDRPIGCIGAGFIMADCHLVSYRKAGFNPVAIASRRPEQAREVSQRHKIPRVYTDYHQLIRDPELEVIDVAVPPDRQAEILREIAVEAPHIRGVLAQKPLGVNYEEAVEIVELYRRKKITLAVNQNMRFDHAVRGCKDLLKRGILGDPVLATIDMRAIPHWMPWQKRQGWVTLRIMSIHHLDTFRYWFGNPQRVFASIRPDPRTSKQFKHRDGICLYILEYANGTRASSCDDVWTGPAREGSAEDIGIRFRVEGHEGLARGTIGWPKYPRRTPSTLDYTSIQHGDHWIKPRWKDVWFPDAFIGPMAELLVALEQNRQPTISGRDNLKTMALVDACYLSAKEHRAVAIREIMGSTA